MGRTKSYDPENLVEAATGLFHAHGFAGTSTQMLVDTLGVNRNSMYSEFGSKQALFEAVLQRYEARFMTDVFGPLESADAGVDAIVELFARFGRDAAGPASGLGCMLCNTAVELAGDAPGGPPFVEQYFARIQAAFTNALSRARERGGLAADVVVEDEARFLTTAAVGIFVMVRARTAPAVIEGAARVARRHLERLLAQGA